MKTYQKVNRKIFKIKLSSAMVSESDYKSRKPKTNRWIRVIDEFGDEESSEARSVGFKFGEGMYVNDDVQQSI